MNEVNSKARVEAYQALKGSWMEGYLADRRAGGAKESSILEYAFHLQWMIRHGLDLQTASLQEIKLWLSDY